MKHGSPWNDAVDVRDLSDVGAEPGRAGRTSLRAAHIAWPIPATFILRDNGFGLVWTITVPTVAGHQTLHLDLTRSPMPRGGVRCYLRCPGLAGHPCGRQVTKLYVRPDSAFFTCRTCHEQVYRSSQTRNRRLWVERLRAEAARTWASGIRHVNPWDAGVRQSLGIVLSRTHSRATDVIDVVIRAK